MGSRDDDRLGAGDVGLVDVAFVERAVGAIVAIEDQRKRLVVANAENDERGQAPGIGVNARHVDAFAGALLADEAAHVLVADPRDQAALQPQARGSDRDVGRAAADRLGKARHVLETPADLRAVEVDRRTADGDDVEGRIGQAGQLRKGALRAKIASPFIRRHGSSGGSPAPTTFWSKSMFEPVIKPDSLEAR